MDILKPHTPQSAPSASRALLQSSVDNFGWVPRQSAYMAESPALLSSYQFAHDAFSQCSLQEEERAVVWITTGIINECSYTVQAHKWIAMHKGVPAQILHQLIHDPHNLPERLSALYHFTRAVILAHGQISAEKVGAFLDAGFTRENMLDVILGVSQKTMSTLLNSIAGTEVEPQFMDVGTEVE